MQDLSNLTQGLAAGASQMATNTVSATPAFGAPGSESEATANVNPSTVPDVTAAPEQNHTETAN